LPCIAGHVGADTAGAVLAVGPHRGDEIVLLIDVGTNAELVLGNRDGLLAASSPTGPAFEGAQISGGQRATAGAIERVRIDRETFEPVLKIIGSDLWSNEPGFAESLPEVGITGICGSGIIEVVGELFLAGIVDTDGTIKGEYADRTLRIVGDGRTFSYVLQAAGERPGISGESSTPELRIAQNDVRAIQLAKGALYAGARLLMDRAGLESVDSVKLAGAFGSHIDPVYALVLGMIPDCDPAKVISVGNAAGSGAVRALLSKADRQEIAEVARTITKVETAIEPRFQEHFVQAMGIPHFTDPYARLAAVVTLPARSESSGPTRTRRRARA
ncbi:MAG: drug:proton antiporter, partial [Acidimicrobiales bacterium]|nr:drug:proton antiporter [Acidimicrobiales bacterium]